MLWVVVEEEEGGVEVVEVEVQRGGVVVVAVWDEFGLLITSLILKSEARGPLCLT